jgi:hypothetical protein
MQPVQQPGIDLSKNGNFTTADCRTMPTNLMQWIHRSLQKSWIKICSQFCPEFLLEKAEKKFEAQCNWALVSTETSIPGANVTNV